MTERLPVFVYGTLREGESNAGVLDGYVETRTPATLPGHHLHLLEYPCVIEAAPSLDPAPVLPEDRSAPAVRGDLVVLDAGSYAAALDRLDWLEGFDPADVDGSLYVRAVATVDTADGEVECWVYLAGAGLRPRLDATNHIASGDWLRR